MNKLIGSSPRGLLPIFFVYRVGLVDVDYGC